MLSPGCGGGAKSKGALYRETLQTTGFYMGRIVIVTREFTPIPSPPLRCLRFRESSRNAFGEACGIYRSDGDQTNSQKGPPYRLPLVGTEVGVAAPRIHYEVLSPTPFLCQAVPKCEGPRNAFVQAWRNLSVRCVITAGKPGPRRRLPVGLGPGYRTRREEHALPIVRDEFRPVIPRSGCSPALPVSASPASSE